MFLKAYENKTILITGASGYLGANVVEALKNTGCHIIRLSGWGTHLPVFNAKAHITDIHENLNDPKTWEKHLEDVDIVLHLAGDSNKNLSNSNPIDNLEGNLKPLIYLLEQCKKQEKKPFIVFASTATIYGIVPSLPVNEKSPINPTSIYDLHKFFGEEYLHFYTSQGFAKGTALRFTNTYGRGNSPAAKPNGIINLMVNMALKGNPLKIFGDGNFQRDFNFIEDAANAVLAAGINASNLNGNTFVISSGQGYPLYETVHMIAENAEKITGKTVPVEYVPAPPGQPLSDKRDFVGDCSAFEKATGWKAHMHFPKGIEKTVRDFYEE